MELLILNGNNGNIRVGVGKPCKITGDSDGSLVTSISKEPWGYIINKKKGDENIPAMNIVNCNVIEIFETKLESKIEVKKESEKAKKKDVNNGNREKNRKNSSV